MTCLVKFNGNEKMWERKIVKKPIQSVSVAGGGCDKTGCDLHPRAKNLIFLLRIIWNNIENRQE